MSLPGSLKILHLADLGRLSASSVMVQSPHWPTLAAELQVRARKLEIGLHFNLTHPFDRNTRSLAHWLVLSQTRALPRDWLRDRLLEQIDLFSEHLQRLPDFIDGHQHVHAFPVIRELLFEAIRQRWGNSPKPYLRAPDCLGHSGGSILKAGVLKAACAGFNKHAQAAGFTTPAWFAGLYDLTPEAGFPRLMSQWLFKAPKRGLLMCHPGSNDPGDPIGAARAWEYHYLVGQAFEEICWENHVTISKFKADYPF